ncbi:hypothetical protein J6590_001619 [Homalodisca vitripennis]|nr:hypothetical protein J6590_001619 [Homalodisca vitripennis]
MSYKDLLASMFLKILSELIHQQALSTALDVEQLSYGGSSAGAAHFTIGQRKRNSFIASPTKKSYHFRLLLPCHSVGEVDEIVLLNKSE